MHGIGVFLHSHALSLLSGLSRWGLVTRTVQAALVLGSCTSSSGFQYISDTRFQWRRLYSLDVEKKQPAPLQHNLTRLYVLARPVLGSAAQHAPINFAARVAARVVTWACRSSRPRIPGAQHQCARSS